MSLRFSALFAAALTLLPSASAQVIAGQLAPTSGSSALIRAETASSAGDGPTSGTASLPAAPQTTVSAVTASPASYITTAGSTYVPVDSWMYPALLRLFSKGYVDSAFLGLRPWTRLSIAHMLDLCADRIATSGDEQAIQTLKALQAEIYPDIEAIAGARHGHLQLESVYTRPLGVAGTSLRDSFHVGQTIVNDYGRPYQPGFNDITGFSGRAEAGRLSAYVRAEYQHAPSTSGYSVPVAQTLSALDLTPYGLNQAVIPQGPIAATNAFRIVEADLSYDLLDHEISFGKTDAWLGPGQGGAFAWSNNAENIYSFRINRVEPLRIPGLSRLVGPVRYDFFVGSLKGHTNPNEPWVHVEKISLKPTPNFEFGFERTVIWGGQGHVPITIHSFLKSFFSFQNVTAAEKFSRDDPGARFGAFDFTYRLPYLRRWVTLYSDSESHDDVTPPSAPRRASIRPGIYLSHFPGAPKLDFRVEAVSTDPDHSRSNGGQFNYWEIAQTQGYTNKGNITGDWIGREAKGGQAWLTYHLGPSEWVQVNYRRAKAAKDFIPGSTGVAPIQGGTTQNLYGVDVVKRLPNDLELHGWLQYEHWNVPLLHAGPQNDTSVAVQFTWHPKEFKKQF